MAAEAPRSRTWRGAGEPEQAAQKGVEGEGCIHSRRDPRCCCCGWKGKRPHQCPVVRCTRFVLLVKEAKVDVLGSRDADPRLPSAAWVVGDPPVPAAATRTDPKVMRAVLTGVFPHQRGRVGCLARHLREGQAGLSLAAAAGKALALPPDRHDELLERDLVDVAHELPVPAAPGGNGLPG